METKTKKFVTDQENVKRAHKSEVDRLTSEVTEVTARLTKKEEAITKLEKEKREITINRDKVSIE